jgi:chromosome segregation ATPase
MDSSPDGSDLRNLQEEIKELQAELAQVEFDRVDLEDQVESLKRDAAQLIEKDGKVARERAEERKTLQAVSFPRR